MLVAPSTTLWPVTRNYTKSDKIFTVTDLDQQKYSSPSLKVLLGRLGIS